MNFRDPLPKERERSFSKWKFTVEGEEYQIFPTANQFFIRKGSDGTLYEIKQDGEGRLFCSCPASVVCKHLLVLQAMHERISQLAHPMVVKEDLLSCD